MIIRLINYGGKICVMGRKTNRWYGVEGREFELKSKEWRSLDLRGGRFLPEV
jgi:hypothetical protein